MKHYISSKVVCPFYRSESTRMIRCGSSETKVHRVFSNAADAKMYKKRFCQAEFHKCPIYRFRSEIEESPSS